MFHSKIKSKALRIHAKSVDSLEYTVRFPAKKKIGVTFRRHNEWAVVKVTPPNSQVIIGSLLVAVNGRRMLLRKFDDAIKAAANALTSGDPFTLTFMAPYKLEGIMKKYEMRRMAKGWKTYYFQLNSGVLRCFNKQGAKMRYEWDLSNETQHQTLLTLAPRNLLNSGELGIMIVKGEEKVILKAEDNIRTQNWGAFLYLSIVLTNGGNPDVYALEAKRIKKMYAKRKSEQEKATAAAAAMITAQQAEQTMEAHKQLALEEERKQKMSIAQAEMLKKAAEKAKDEEERAEIIKAEHKAEQAAKEAEARAKEEREDEAVAQGVFTRASMSLNAAEAQAMAEKIAQEGASEESSSSAPEDESTEATEPPSPSPAFVVVVSEENDTNDIPQSPAPVRKTSLFLPVTEEEEGEEEAEAEATKEEVPPDDEPEEEAAPQDEEAAPLPEAKEEPEPEQQAEEESSVQEPSEEPMTEPEVFEAEVVEHDAEEREKALAEVLAEDAKEEEEAEQASSQEATTAGVEEPAEKSAEIDAPTTDTSAPETESSPSEETAPPTDEPQELPLESSLSQDEDEEAKMMTDYAKLANKVEEHEIEEAQREMEEEMAALGATANDDVEDFDFDREEEISDMAHMVALAASAKLMESAPEIVPDESPENDMTDYGPSGIFDKMDNTDDQEAEEDALRAMDRMSLADAVATPKDVRVRPTKREKGRRSIFEKWHKQAEEVAKTADPKLRVSEYQPTMMKTKNDRAWMAQL